MKEFLEEHGGWTEENRYKVFYFLIIFEIFIPFLDLFCV